MATIVYGDKEIRKVETIEIYKKNNLRPSTVIIADEDYLTKIEIPGNIDLFLEVKGNVTDLESTNSACIVGNVQYADVKNIAKIEGFIKNVKGCAPIIDKDLRITTGRQYIYQSAVTEVTMLDKEKLDIDYWDKKQYNVVEVIGNVKKIIYNADSFPVIIGDVKNVKVDNLLKVKGNVTELNVGNRVFYTNEVMPETDFRDILIKHIDEKLKYDKYRNNCFKNKAEALKFDFEMAE